MSKRVQVVFDGLATAQLERLQESTGRGVGDVLKEALGFYDWARKEVEAGRTIAVVDHERNVVRQFEIGFRPEARTGLTKSQWEFVARWAERPDHTWLVRPFLRALAEFIRSELKELAKKAGKR